jgi:hypothetical protein
MYSNSGKIFARPPRILRTYTTPWPNYPVGKVRSGLIKRLDKEAEQVTILAKADYERQKPQFGLVKAGAKTSL